MNWKKVVSMLLVGAMTLSMVACGGSSNDSAANNDNAAVSGTESTGGEEVTGDNKLVIWTLQKT